MGRKHFFRVTQLCLSFFLIHGCAAKEKVTDTESSKKTHANKCYKKLHTLKITQRDISHVVFSQDKKFLAMTTEKGKVLVWSVKDWKIAHTFDIKSRKGETALFSPNSRMLAVSHDNEIQIWSLISGKLVRKLRGHNSSVTSSYLGYSPGGMQTATKTDKARISSMSFSPDNRFLATGSDDKTIKLWDVTTGKLISTLNGHTDTIQALEFSANSRQLLSGSLDSTIKIWTIPQGRVSKTFTVTRPVGQSSMVYAASFLPGEKYICGVSQDGTWHKWRVTTGALVKVSTSDYLNVIYVSGNRSRYAIGSWNIDLRHQGKGRIDVYDLNSGRRLCLISETVVLMGSLALSHDGTLMAVGGTSGIESVQIFEIPPTK